MRHRVAIRIGRGLATPLLLHHLAYGSCTKAVRSRLSFNVQPVHSELIEVFARKSKSKSRRAAETPRTMSRLGCIPDQPTAHPPFAQLPVASSPPLFPVIAAKAAANPGVEILETGANFTVAIVFPPPEQVTLDL